MSQGGLLSLKWNNHCSTFLHILSTLHRKQSYDDATVACDGKLYPVHKIVLSTCSEYFEEMFEKTHGKHPVIVLKDIKKEVFEALLKYMYIGEVNVVQEKLSELINAAECLKIKGLAVPDEEPEPKTHSASSKGRGNSNSSLSSSHPPSEKDPYQSYNRNSRASANNQSSKRKEYQNFNNNHAPPRKILRASNELSKSDNVCGSNARDADDYHTYDSSLRQRKSCESREGRSVDERASLLPSPGLTGREEDEVAIWPTNVKEEPIDPAPDEANVDSSGSVGPSDYVDDGTISGSHDDEGDGNSGTGGDVTVCPPSSAPQSDGKNDEPEVGATDDQHDEVVDSKVEVGEIEESSDWEESFLNKGEGDDAEALNNILSGDDASSTAAEDRAPGWPSDDRLTCALQRYNHATQHYSVSHLPHEAQQSYHQATNPPQLNHVIQDTSSLSPVPLLSGGSLMACQEKRFHCPICPYATHKKDHITKHFRTHTGEKPFSCAHCQYRTANKANLDRHAKLHVEMARFECRWCAFTSVSSEELDLHQKNVHCRSSPDQPAV